MGMEISMLSIEHFGNIYESIANDEFSIDDGEWNQNLPNPRFSWSKGDSPFPPRRDFWRLDNTGPRGEFNSQEKLLYQIRSVSDQLIW